MKGRTVGIVVGAIAVLVVLGLIGWLGGFLGGTSEPVAGAVPDGAKVKVGFFYPVQGAEQDGLNQSGATQKQQEALVDHVNSNGGLAGHQIEGVYLPFDTTNTDPTYPLQLCKQMTEDNDVFAVVEGNNVYDDTIQCYVDHETMVFYVGLTQFSKSAISKWNPYFWAPSFPTLDRSMAATLTGLEQAGFFADAKKVGYVYVDIPSSKDAIDQVVTPMLSDLGFNDPVSVGIAVGGDPNAAVTALTNAVVKFKEAGVDRVFYINDNGALAVYFAKLADSQQYTPRYGLQTQDGPGATSFLIPPSQLKDAVGVGYNQWLDVATAQSDGFPGSEAESQCYAIMNDAGIPTPNPPGRDGQATTTMLEYCDGVLFLQAGSAGLEELAPSTFTSAAEKLEASFQNSNGYAGNSMARPDSRDLVNAYRMLKFDPACTNGFNPEGGKTDGCWVMASNESIDFPTQ